VGSQARQTERTLRERGAQVWAKGGNEEKKIRQPSEIRLVASHDLFLWAPQKVQEVRKKEKA